MGGTRGYMIQPSAHPFPHPCPQESAARMFYFPMVLADRKCIEAIVKHSSFKDLKYIPQSDGGGYRRRLERQRRSEVNPMPIPQRGRDPHPYHNPHHRR